MIKLILIILFLATGQLVAGETCVWQVYKDSFTVEQWDVLKDVAHAKVANANQPIQFFRIIKRPGGLAVMGDCSIRTLVKVQNAEATGYIQYIGLYHYTNQGYDRKHDDWPVLKQFFYNISKSTYTVEVSTP